MNVVALKSGSRTADGDCRHPVRALRLGEPSGKSRDFSQPCVLKIHRGESPALFPWGSLKPDLPAAPGPHAWCSGTGPGLDAAAPQTPGRGAGRTGWTDRRPDGSPGRGERVCGSRRAGLGRGSRARRGRTSPTAGEPGVSVPSEGRLRPTCRPGCCRGWEHLAAGACGPRHPLFPRLLTP